MEPAASDNPQPHQHYLERLRQFYEHYNPEKLHRIEEYLAAYQGREEQLFATLVGKYGPEPNAKQAPGFKSPGDEGISHYSGKRCRFPKEVAPEEGNTDVVTPYWSGLAAPVNERDLLRLLLTSETHNIELQKCFMGVLPSHPDSAWNGMTYMINQDETDELESEFLEHMWYGSLKHKKTLVHDGKTVIRFTLYCTEECQKRGHERWKLNMYKSTAATYALIRVIWDPIVVPEPMPQSFSYLSADFVHGSPVGSTRSSESITQPLQPVSAPPQRCDDITEKVATMLSDFESRIFSRLDNIESRLTVLENQYKQK